MRNDAFAWTFEATEASTVLKRTLSIGLILQMQRFDREFVINYDASDASFYAIFHHGVVPCSSLPRLHHVSSQLGNIQA